jgi:hypothetical protein
VSLSSLLTHTCTVTRQGTCTSDAGDTVATGVWDDVLATRVPCLAQQVSGTTDAQQQRERWTARWRVFIDPAHVPALLPRDRITVTLPSCQTYVLTVTEVRAASQPGRVHHVQLDCEEVVG